MDEIATTRLSSKGQVVIPEAIRTRLGLRPGTQFVVLGEDNTVVLKPISAPSMRPSPMLLAPRVKPGSADRKSQASTESTNIDPNPVLLLS